MCIAACDFVIRMISTGRQASPKFQCAPFVPNAGMHWRCPACGVRAGAIAMAVFRCMAHERCGRGWPNLDGAPQTRRACRRPRVPDPMDAWAHAWRRGGAGRAGAPAGIMMSRLNGAGSSRRLVPGLPSAECGVPRACLSPRAVDVDPHLSLAAPVAGHPSTPGAPCDPAARHPYIAASLPAPVTVRPYIAVRPWRRWAAIVSRGRRREARAVRIGRPAGRAVRAGRPISGRRGRHGLGRSGTEPAAGADEGGGQSDGAQQGASIHGVSCSVFEAALH